VAFNPYTNHIYVTNWDSYSVSVINGASNTIVTTVLVGTGPSGVAVNPNTNLIYVANRTDNTVSVIDGASNTEIDTDGDPANGITRIAVGSYPQGVAVNPSTNRIYVANSGDGNSDGTVSVADGASNTVVASVAVGRNLLEEGAGVAVNPGTNRIYVTNSLDDTVSVIEDINLTGAWGYVYAIGATTFGECTTVLLQTDGGLSSTTNVECEAGGSPTATGGELTGTVTDGTVTGQIAFAWPAGTAYFSGTASADGNTQQGNWGGDPGNLPNTYTGSRLTDTPPGSGVTVTADSGGRTIDVTFDEVDVAGGTAIISDSSAAGTLPGQFQVLGLFFHVITTATYSPPLIVCASYEDADNNGYEDTTGSDETTLRILHDEGGSFVDRTDFINTDYVINKLCASVTSLSEFALVVPNSVGGIAELPEVAGTPLEAPESSGANVGLIVAAVVAASVVTLAGGAWYARRRWLR
jgi:YVTN family beta-propeller protein